MNTKNKARFSRRAFLAAAAVGGAGLVLPGTARATAKGEPVATLLDLSKCIGCEACVLACQETNGHKFPEPQKPFPKMYPARVKAEDWSERRDTTDRLTPYNWLFIQRATVEHQGQNLEINIPRRCMHCQNAPCANLCPFGACSTQADGIVRIDSGVCLGGAKCRQVCPWHIPQRQTGVGMYLNLMPGFAGNGVMYKCDRCFDRVAQGELPACIEACPEQVQSIGPRKEIVRRAHELAESMGGYIYGETENGGTNTLYVSPVPFEALNAALHAEHGENKPKAMASGFPHLGQVANSMANEENLAWATLAAPVAGLVAGVVGLGRILKRGGKENDYE
ncbi:4Fe-4S dicluster domain-containing protein [Desulfocurvibacter africanus]|uniref:4Fe-4S ferredoxin-type domain-containing protein n=1 Tax=Desulfocurvibacter africanus subsp. africanus str. Walvis Bay TaxID=690850 RepID=F3Z0B6_DESAF|nr:4Fe-4S dicluster domain-containing protein [Desulfocurvibacter africanus]EGJ49818.1 hypothetical protein Desaf_1481 [Desulfocurvibacter africanus subsp. africanus str. Walvis Bay]